MHWHVLRTDTKVTGAPITKTFDVGVAPSYRAGDDVIRADRSKLHDSKVQGERVGNVIATWARFSCDNQAHER